MTGHYRIIRAVVVNLDKNLRPIPGTATTVTVEERTPVGR